jgi:hypothetical protein
VKDEDALKALLSWQHIWCDSRCKVSMDGRDLYKSMWLEIYLSLANTLIV